MDKVILSQQVKKEELAKPEIDRDSNRRFIVQIPGCFMLPETGSAVFCQIVNMSNTGIGIISQSFMPPDTTIMWVTLEQVLPFKVVWCLERVSPNDASYKYQCGLLSLDQKVYLENLFGSIQQHSE